MKDSKANLNQTKKILIIRKIIWKVRFTFSSYKKIWFNGYSLYSLNNVSTPISILSAKEIINKLPNNVGFTMEIPKEWVEENKRYYYSLSLKSFIEIINILKIK